MIIGKGWSKISWAVALTTTLFYLILSASTEFSVFAPISISQLTLYVSSVVIGVAAVLVTDGFTAAPRVAILAAVVLLPAAAYGVCLVLMWTSIGGRVLLDFFIMQASRRVLVHLLVLGLTCGLGVIIGFVADTFVVR